MNTEHQKPEAGGSPVDCRARPLAWAIFVDSGNARMWSTLQPHVQKLADAEGLEVTPLYGQAALDALVAQRDGLMQTLRDEMDENLRLRELGGALPDENITAMTERLIRERDSLRARVLHLEAQCEDGAASEQRWLDWLVKHGLLHYYGACKRPDGTDGPAWVLRTPYMTNGDSCEAWHATSAAGALRKFLGA